MIIPKGMVNAIYRNEEIAQYKGNPLIEALPPRLTPVQVKHGLSEKIDIDPSEVFLDNQTRIHSVSQLINGYFQPFSSHLQLEARLSLMIRQGYVGRNIGSGDLNRHIQNGYERVMRGNLDVCRFDHVESTAKSMAFIGCSGSGKTSSINRILETYPQRIYHEQYNFNQIVFLRIECPHDGSLKSLCYNFFREIDLILGENYVRRYVEKRNSIETLIAQMALIASTHAIGLLVIDEIQHLSRKLSGGSEKMLSFFVSLVNKISVPVVMVGTPKARSIFEQDLRSARRATGYGSVLWEPIKKPSTDDDVSRTEWGALTNKLWKSQWLRKATPEISEEIRETWYDLTQGIMDFVVKLFVFSQIRAIDTGIERITFKLMKKVYEEEFKPIHSMINALRSGDPYEISKYSDLTIPKTTNKYKEPDMLNLIEKAPVEKNKIRKRTVKNIRQNEWHTLESSDLRFVFSQSDNENDVYAFLEKEELLFDTESWIDSFG